MKTALNPAACLKMLTRSFKYAQNVTALIKL